MREHTALKISAFATIRYRTEVVSHRTMALNGEIMGFQTGFG